MRERENERTREREKERMRGRENERMRERESEVGFNIREQEKVNYR